MSNEDNRYLKKQEILDIAKSSLNKSLKEFGFDTVAKGKGSVGSFIEEYIFGIPNNSDPNPDFINEHIELKTTGFKKLQNGNLVAKERLVLNMINYQDEANATFETSSFYRKNRDILLMVYLYTKELNPSDFQILNYIMLEFEHSLYFKIIKRDWETIHNKILRGEAHLISESDTEILAACTKGANSKKLTFQPFSEIMAKPRAYSFKPKFLTNLYYETLHEISPYVSFISDDEWMNNPLEEMYKDKLSKYKGLLVKNLAFMFKVNLKTKQYLFNIAQGMLGLKGKESSTREMEIENIKLKVVRLRKNGTPYESMSFKAFDFTELVNTKWEESTIREDFVDWKLMFFVFKDDDKGNCYFDEVLFFNVPNSLIDSSFKEMYENAAELIKNGEAFYYDENGDLKDKFFKERRNSNGVCHIRPHGKNKDDQFKLPVQDKITGITSYTKQCFWFNKKYIKELIKQLEENEKVGE